MARRSDTLTTGPAPLPVHPATDVYRSASFRLALIYLGLFAASVLLLLGFIYWSTAGYMERQADAAIEADIELLAERYQTRGLTGLTALIQERVSEDPTRSNLYLLADPSLRRLVGNLDGWPAAEENAEGWINFLLRDRDDPPTEWHGARARAFTLRGDFRLLVGRDMHELEAIRSLIVETLAWGLAITLVLGLGGGLAMSRSMLRRLEVINQASRDIVGGDLSRRVPVSPRGDEYDELASHLNAMLDRIQDLMEDVRRVADNIAHDLNTPLTRLRNELESLRSAAGDRPELLSGVDRALADADALLNTFAALLRIARIESGDRREGFAPVALARLLADVVDFYEPLAEQRGLTLELDVETEVTVDGDRDLLFQAFANLLDNALKYTPQSGRVRVGLNRVSAAPGVIVADDGPGIAAGERDKVLRRFYRVEASRSRPGSGLGLALVAAVAKLHDARLQLGDNDPGLRVTFTFPARSGD